MPVYPPAAGGGTTALTIAEVDGNPSLSANALIVSNGSLTNSGGGTATVVTGGGGGGSVTFHDEGAAIGTGTILNFVGAGVTATFSGGTAIATISGGTAAGSIVFLDEGTIAGTATALNVVGSSGTVAYSGGTATLTLSGGGLGHSFIGYNTVGASTQTFAADTTYYAKKVTLASAGLLCNIGAYLSNSSSNDVGINAAVYSDIAGAVGIPIALGEQLNNQSQVILTSTARWIHVPVSIYLAAGDYWIAIRVNRWSSATSIAYDTGGSDVSFGSGTNNSLPSGPTTTDTTRKLSIRASFLS